MQVTRSLLVVSLVARTTLADSTTIDFSLEKSDSAQRIHRDLCGLSIEADRFPDWAGNVSHGNSFTYNLMNNIKEKTKVAPPIRVGGGSQDFIISMPEVTGDPGFYNIFAPVPDKDDLESTKQLLPQAHFTGAGYHYWLSACNFPATTQFTFGVNLLAGNASEAVAQVKQIESAFADSACKDVSLYAIAIGNEADQWNDGNKRDEDWDIYAYADQQFEYYQAITDELGDNGRKYRFGDSASRWSVKGMLNTDVWDTDMNSSINSLSVHHYHSTGKLDKPSDWPEKASGLISKTSIREEVDYYTDSVIRARDAGVAFVLGETNSFASHGQQGVSNSAASTIWTVDYSLHAATVGISGLFFHQGVGYNYSAFEPIDGVGSNITDYDPDAKHYTMPQYYGYIIVAEAIGKTTRAYIDEITTDDDTPLAIYRIFEGDELKRLVLINSEPWTVISEGDRPETSITLSALSGYKDVTYKLLEFESLSALSGLTWGGQTYETDSGKADGEKIFHEMDSDGIITLQASSIALVYL